MKLFIFRILLWTVLLAPVRYGWASTYYVDPDAGSIDNTGSMSNPWNTLQAVFEADKEIGAGDTLLLMSGRHGSPRIEGRNDDYRFIRAADGEQPLLQSIVFSNAEKWVLSGLTVSPSTGGNGGSSRIIYIQNSSSHIIINDCDVYSEDDTEGWSGNDWIERAPHNAIDIFAPYCTVSDCRVRNIFYGIIVNVEGVGALVEHNLVDGFRGDGIRCLADSGIFQYNTVTNSIDVGDDHHDDGFQSWTGGRGDPVGTLVVRDVVLRGNTIINTTDLNNPLASGHMQAMGFFDGFFENWLVENNVIINNHPHGISFLGARNCVIVNNTMIDGDPDSGDEPWIWVTPHKNGTISTGNIIRNNITTQLNIPNPQTTDHNLVITPDEYGDYFVDASAFNLHLKEGSPAIDAGSADSAPELDREAKLRPAGQSFDIGAYEFGAVSRSFRPINRAGQGTAIGNIAVEYMLRHRGFRIAFTLPRPGVFQVRIVSMAGAVVAALPSSRYPAGTHSLWLASADLLPGVYILEFLKRERTYLVKPVAVSASRPANAP
jgi:parallel beta-helix repeat protein